SNGSAADMFHSGTLLEDRTPGATADSWTYDPLSTLRGEAEPADDPSFLTSQRAVANLFDEGVIYHSAPLAAVTEVSGFVKLTVWLAMDVPDTDLSADLYAILPDGSSVALASGAMRARYRESRRQEKLVKPGVAEKYVFDNFFFFSRQLPKGSRLRLVVSSVNSAGSEKNYNSGGVVAQETGKDARTAHIQLLHDAEHPSALELPVVK
ncbi:MAG TPA: CocE/NonD family hydrolase, partial [Candidatus Acidoferrum sp.]